MSEKAEEFAARLLEGTQAGKLKWSVAPDSEAESYKYEAEDGISFSIKRVARGDDKTVSFELTESGRIVLIDSESNFLNYGADSAMAREQAMNFLSSRRPESSSAVANDARLKRFRLYSDLFFAARETAEGQDQAIRKAQQFLSKLA
jgi:hypothetical protein